MSEIESLTKLLNERLIEEGSPFLIGDIVEVNTKEEENNEYGDWNITKFFDGLKGEVICVVKKTFGSVKRWEAVIEFDGPVFNARGEEVSTTHYFTPGITVDDSETTHFCLIGKVENTFALTEKECFVKKRKDAQIEFDF